jgi:hypothetical protein
VPGTAYVDPLAWDPLILKFCESFGGGFPLRDSSLARGWQLPHAGQLGRGAPDRVT